MLRCRHKVGPCPVQHSVVTALQWPPEQAWDRTDMARALWSEGTGGCGIGLSCRQGWSRVQEELARNGLCHFSSGVGPTAVAQIRTGLSLFCFVLVLVVLTYRRAATSSQVSPAFRAASVLVGS